MSQHQLRALAKRLAVLESDRLNRKQPTTGFSSIVDGAIVSVDEDDVPQMIIGKQFDDTQTSAVYVGPPPPTPQTPLVTESVAGLRVYWDGTFYDGSVAPMDFARVTVHAHPMSTFEDYDPLDQRYIVAAFNQATGGEAICSLPYEEHIVYLVAWSQAGKFSEPSIAAFGTPSKIAALDIADEVNAAIAAGEDAAADAAAAAAQALDAYNLATGLSDDVSTAQAAADAASAAAALASSDASAALSAASDAAADAAEAAGLVADKAVIRMQAAAPGAEDENENTLWIDTDDGNKPKRWDGDSWEPVQDATAVQAAADAATAASAAATAQSAATAAQSAADAAQATATAVEELTDSWRTTGEVTIDGGMITADSILAAAIGAGQITAAKIAGLAIEAAHIAAGAIEAVHIAVGAITADAIEAGAVKSDAIEAGAIKANHLELGTLEVGSQAAGAIRVGESYWNKTEGLVIPQPGGGTITLPADGVTPATITAKLVAVSLDVQGDLAISGVGEVRGILKISNGVGDPTVRPTLTQTWPKQFITALQQVVPGVSNGNIYSGLTQHPTNSNIWCTAVSYFGGGIRQYNKTTGIISVYPDATQDKTWRDDFYPEGGIATATHGGQSYFYLLGSDANRSGGWYIYEINATTFEKTQELFVGLANAFGGYRPRIGSVGVGGSQVGLLWSGAGGQVFFRTYSPSSGMAVVKNYTLDDHDERFDWGGFYYRSTYGTLDHRIYVARQNGQINVYDLNYTASTATEITAEAFESASGSKIMGFSFNDEVDNGTPVSYDDFAYGYVYSDNITEREYEAGYTNADRDNSNYPVGHPDAGTPSGYHETMISPTTTYTVSPRAWLKIETSPPHHVAHEGDELLVDKANRIGIYVGDVGGPLHWQIYLDAYERVYSPVDNFVESAITPPGSNSFATADAAPGSIKSDAEDGAGALIDLDGSGAWRLGDASADVTGAVTIDGDLTITGAVLSSDNLNAVRITNTANQNIGTSFADVTLDELVYDLGGTALTADTANSRVTINEDGLYFIEALVYWANGNAGRRAVRVNGSGVGVLTTSETAAAASSPSNFPIGVTYALTAGTQITVTALQTGQTNLALANTFVPSYLAVRKIA